MKEPADCPEVVVRHLRVREHSNCLAVAICYLRAEELGAFLAVDGLWGGTGIESREVDEFLNTRLSRQPGDQSGPFHMDAIEVIVPDGKTVEE